jgi:CpeT protein
MHHWFKNIAIFVFAIGLYKGTVAQSVTQKDLKRLERYMTGEFSSEAQSKADTNYFHIKLRMTRCSLNNNAGFWLYVEQAVAGAENKPYRQRVYHVFRESDSTIVSKVYELKNPAQYIGAWKDKVKLGVLKTDSLEDRQGCSIYLQKRGKKYLQAPHPEKNV